MRYTVAMLMALIVLMPCFLYCSDPPDRPSIMPLDTRGPAAKDVNLTVNHPYPDIYVNKSAGLIVNVTVANCGSVYVNESFNVSLTIVNKDNPLIKFTDMHTVAGLGKPGNSTTFSFKNWTTSFSLGDFLLNVTAGLPGDLVKTNDTVKFDIHIQPDAQTPKITLESPKVLPSKGTIATNFNFSVLYTYDGLPDKINITLDGVVHDLLPSDPSDMNASDGKGYFYSTKLAARDLHSFYFQAAWGNATAKTAELGSPWVNYTVQNERVTPEKGNITDLYNFTLTYGDYNNNAPDLKVVIGPYEFPFYPINPLDTDYTDANNNFYCKAYGYQFGIGPKTWSISLANPTDIASIGPYNFTGASNATGYLNGRAKGADGFPLRDVQVTLSPLGYSTTTDGAGDYQFEVPTGHKYNVLFTKGGYYNYSFMDITIFKDRVSYANATLIPLPVGGTVEGWAIDSSRKAPVSGVLMQLKTLQGTLNTATDQSGHFKFAGVPAQTGANLTALPENYIGKSALVSIVELGTTQVNFTLTEKAPPLTVSPANNTMDLPVDAPFYIDFKEAVNDSTILVELRKADGGGHNTSMNYDPDSRRATVTPLAHLDYNADYTLVLRKGLMSMAGKSLLWRDFALFYRTTYKPLGNYTLFPAPNQDQVPLDVTLTITMDVLVKNETINIVLQKTESGLSLSGEVALDYIYPENGTTAHSRITFKPFKNLTTDAIYTVKLTNLLTDELGHFVLEEDLTWFFKTIGRPDADGDGVPDDSDAFPDDPNEWADTDKDGHGDVGDAFPTDKSEWADMDNDGRGDNSDPDRDGDGIPNDWEAAHGLNASDPIDASLDTDGDKYANLEEYYKGTDPLDPEDHPEDENGDEETPLSTLVIMILIAIVIAIIAVAVIFFVNKSRHDLTSAESRPPEAAASQTEPSEDTLQERTQEQEAVVSEANGEPPEDGQDEKGEAKEVGQDDKDSGPDGADEGPDMSEGPAEEGGGEEEGEDEGGRNDEGAQGGEEE